MSDGMSQANLRVSRLQWHQVVGALCFLMVLPAQGGAAVRVDHESPVALARSYFDAFTQEDVEAVLECYMPESRAAIKGLLGYVNFGMKEAKLHYELVSEAEDRAMVKVSGTYVTPSAERKDLETTIKLKKLNNAWYLDDK